MRLGLFLGFLIGAVAMLVVMPFVNFQGKNAKWNKWIRWTMVTLAAIFLVISLVAMASSGASLGEQGLFGDLELHSCSNGKTYTCQGGTSGCYSDSPMFC